MFGNRCTVWKVRAMPSRVIWLRRQPDERLPSNSDVPAVRLVERR